MLIRLKGGNELHAKVVHVGNEAYGAWCRMRQWTSGHATHGFVPDDVAVFIAGRKSILKRLLSAPPPFTAGLLEPRQGGYVVRDCEEDLSDVAPARATSTREDAR